MATGIVSRALSRTGAHALSAALFGLALATYLVLLAATALKAACHRDTIRGELQDPGRLFGHFTLVAASGVLATRSPARITACVLLVIAALAWTALALAAAGLRRLGTHLVLRQADGTWFLATVGLQALVLTLIRIHPGRTVLTGALLLWGTGVLLYAATLATVLRRLLSTLPPAARLAPSYWVAMGAAAISTLAGTQLLTRSALLPPLARVPLGGTVLTLWAWATLLIPLLVAAGIWRHLHHRVPLAYEPALWCIVFPVGMYATATAELTSAQRIGALTRPHPLLPSLLPSLLAWAALAAWLAVGLRCLTDRLGPRSRHEAPAHR
ncbi:tellurite resistance/C4-dicarboxylate transporter family protein [Streptomyces sp. MST-110588]|nr:tellurite resistance/C4-dicarboxylate transporter family protein [Streptomyces sp. MST-110588]